VKIPNPRHLLPRLASPAVHCGDIPKRCGGKTVPATCVRGLLLHLSFGL
jgi:hypothetical protein